MTSEQFGEVKVCLTTDCHRAAIASLRRGLCMTCYSSAKKMVEAGTTTWDELVHLGVVLPFSSSELFAKAFNKAKENPRQP